MSLETNLLSTLLGGKTEITTTRALFNHFQTFALMLMLKDHVEHQPDPEAYAKTIIESWRKIVLARHHQEMTSLDEIRASPIGTMFAGFIASEQSAQEECSTALRIITESLMALLIPKKE